MKRLKTYTQDDSGGLTLHFSDKSTALADVLIGADGIRSATRKALFEGLAKTSPSEIDVQRLSEYIDSKWTGTVVYRSLIPTERLEKLYPGSSATGNMMFYCGKNRVSIHLRFFLDIDILTFFTC
ncbi:hypothetical protein SERLADRAFT_481108 [Serpula lacrymans var. lacrymans S7.9]|uniref:FAD-binding domain-containing protein n=1 Tax=Serpula lacrymans var. lacrymans (strain S7.9) TaxID=578457 RepID=F8PEJ0_SERL9|nr:uncharacterized protein SERLADRAFT_481108 [Serpula lacrymans var. lacrymans S7.9]EGO18441.1 hypothetical protein SERLADRAFT_481108 [Serpula lacrymans var. lacrymans S7.9]